MSAYGPAHQQNHVQAGNIALSVRVILSWLESIGRRDSQGPNVVDMTDREVDDALARSFLAGLPPELAGRLRAEGQRADYPAGTTVYRAGSGSQAGLVVGACCGCT